MPIRHAPIAEMVKHSPFKGGIPGSSPGGSTMKKCTKCKNDKELLEFNKNSSKKDGLNNICRLCSNQRSKQYYDNNVEHHKSVTRKRNKKRILENRQKLFDYYKTHPCVDCGINNPVVLDFDHRDNVNKIANVSQLVGGGYRWETVQEEIDKCDVRCANCHRIRTSIQFDWYKGLI